MKEKILYVSKHYPSCMVDEVKKHTKNGYFDNASYNYQNTLIRGLDTYLDLTILTQPPIGSWPKQYSEITIAQKPFSHIEGSQDECVGFCNIVGLKMISKARKMYCRVKSRLQADKEIKTIVVYGLHSPFLLAMKHIKRRFPYVKILQVVPDLPQFMGHQGGLHDFMKLFDYKLINSLCAYCDGFVLFSEPMKESLNLHGNPYIVIEGICDDSERVYKTEKSKERSILYTGSLDVRYSVDRLVSAFRTTTNPDYRLWVRGNGFHAALVKDAAKEDSRIKYFEPMSRQDLLELQHQATVLVNPMLPTEASAKYFFPSKTMDYMASGTPVLMYKLPCLPSDYYDYLFLLENDSINTLTNKIEELFNMTDETLAEFGDKASKFVLEQKNPQAQASKIREFIGRI